MVPSSEVTSILISVTAPSLRGTSFPPSPPYQYNKFCVSNLFFIYIAVFCWFDWFTYSGEIELQAKNCCITVDLSIGMVYLAWFSETYEQN